MSPAAKAIKKAKNPDSKVATQRIEAAGLIGSNAGDLIAGDLKALRKLKLTAGEKKAAYAFSGYGPMSSDKKWVIVIV